MQLLNGKCCFCGGSGIFPVLIVPGFDDYSAIIFGMCLVILKGIFINILQLVLIAADSVLVIVVAVICWFTF